MTNVSTYAAPRRSSAGTSQDGPVLLATKPSGGLDAPLAVARWLATREERELRVVSVLERNDATSVVAGDPHLPLQFFDEERSTLAAQIQQELWFKARSRTIPEVDVVEGSSLEPIMEMARAHRARVIVIGTGRHDRIGRYIYGERALQILSIADRPVLVVPRDALAGPVSVAVVAVDFRPASLRAARAVLPMLSEGGRLILVHVKTGASLDEDTAGWWNDAYERRCADLFAQFQRQLPSMPGITVETKFLRGEAVRTILGYARAHGAGLIACGRLGHSLLDRVLVGSVSSALVRQATCPVLVAPELPGDAMT
ncbi:MAG: UspA protein [Gemmatimonadetes bacterium]|nr:UspA protein [Gemmatimonadota bacterium]